MTDIPPKQTVNGTAAARVVPGHDMPAGVPPDDVHGADAAGDGERGALVSIHAAAMQAGGDSFPVLKAFQDYLDTERRQARRRLTLLSGFFVFLMIVVVGGFLAAGYKVFGYMKQTQDILLRAAIPAAAPAPPAAPAVPPLPAFAPPPAPPAAVSAAGAGEERPPAGIDAELRALREALSELRDRNAELRAGLAAAAAAAAAPPATATVQTPAPAPVVAQAAPPATAAVQPPAATPVAQTPAPATATVQPPAATPPSADMPVQSAAVVAPRPPLEFPATPITPVTPEGFADATIHLPAGVRDEPPVPWRLFVPTR